MDNIDKFILAVSVASIIVPNPIIYIGMAYTSYNIISNQIKKYLD